MAHFKSLKVKEKRYVFDYLRNREDSAPAAAVFCRFPMIDENFVSEPKLSLFDGINREKFINGESGEITKLITAFTAHFNRNYGKPDYAYFARECIEHFENYFYDGKEIKTVDDFLALPECQWAVIAADCYQYAIAKDEFTMGE